MRGYTKSKSLLRSPSAYMHAVRRRSPLNTGLVPPSGKGRLIQAWFLWLFRIISPASIATLDIRVVEAISFGKYNIAELVHETIKSGFA